MTERSLAGKRIVVTRPREQAEGLAARLRAAGGEPVLVPAIEIHDLADLAAFHAIAERLEAFDCAIFVSPIAVRKAMAHLRARRGARPWPAALRVAAIGRGSQRALQEAGIAAALAPSGQADSEALLAMPDLAQPAGQRVLIFRGRGGRELLGRTLAERGAHVEYAECYERAMPASGAAELRAALESAIDAVTVSSGEGLANLHAMLDEPGRARLGAAPVVVPNARVADAAAALGLRHVIVAGPGDAEVVSALVAYFASAK